ncbi:bacillithiol system redox-active protein YtxJ [Chitinophaga oryziterrae]|uniref:Bacillithiol system redox-active protein YtxJ n=1 Tax=Chitinophaga oryziterrae TaxID=1031224 RepID=A0A6N8JDD0_9BACT|nr:bacillithiol system redox-active protein YtxJ [Chitinophaga oryziterrae]MVT43223.1 bacillithiol system redox-active protein YtxJ [Chitinophaga oryziterrae]
MNWIPLTTETQLSEIKATSAEKPVVIFKHSTRCSISAVAKSRLERGAGPENISFYYLDLIRFRDLSNKVAADFAIGHESPQVLLIRNGECVYDESHGGIRMEELEAHAN